jgi:hypothetical protein
MLILGVGSMLKRPSLEGCRSFCVTDHNRETYVYRSCLCFPWGIRMDIGMFTPWGTCRKLRYSYFKHPQFSICIRFWPVAIQYTLANPVTLNPDQNMKNEKFCSQFSTYFSRHVGFRSKRTFRLWWGQRERLKPLKKISKDWLELDEGDPGFQLQTQLEIAAVIFIYFH